MKVPTAQASAGPVADTLASVLSVGFSVFLRVDGRLDLPDRSRRPPRPGAVTAPTVTAAVASRA
jgi:hypothetical protein